MVEQEIARGVAHHLVQRRPRRLRIERIVEQLLDPGGEQIVHCATPGVAQGPGAPRGGARAARFVWAHLYFARDRATSCSRLLGRERCMPGARRRRLDLGKPEIRRAAMALPRGGGHAAIGAGQRELSLKRLFGHEHDAQRGALPRRPRRGQERDLARRVTGGRRALRPRVPRRESTKECAGNQRQRCRCSPDELACRKHGIPCPCLARRHNWLKTMAKVDRPSEFRPPGMRVPPDHGAPLRVEGLTAAQKPRER
jgi:hypothetical protein